MAEQADPRPEGRISRRDALRVGAAAGGVLWATPVVQALNVTPAAAQTGSPETPTGTCSGFAYAISAKSVTEVPGAGPQTIDLPPTLSSNGAELCVVNLTADPLTMSPDSTIGQGVCVQGTCPASFTAEWIDFTIPGAGVSVKSEGLMSRAEADCTTGAKTAWTIAYLKIHTQEFFNLSSDDPDPVPPPGIDLADLMIPGLTGTIDVVHTGNLGTPNSSFIDLLYINYKYEPGGGIVTTGEIRVGHAEASAAGCP